MQANQYIITLLFSDKESMKYSIHRQRYFEAKEEANDVKDSWNNSNRGSYITDFSIKEIKYEDFKRQNSFGDTRHTPKSKVRKSRSSENEE